MTPVPTPVKAVVFDAYGTLLDVHAAMERHTALLPPDWERLSVEWRQKQLEYSWVDALTGGPRRDFWTLTRDALRFVAARHHVSDETVLSTLLDTYRELPAFADARPALRALRARGIGTAILSNGSPDMLDAAVRAAGLASLLDHVLSVEAAGTFKPHPSVYALAEAATGLAPAEMAFVSGNAWDAQAARRYGFQVFWCNRAGLPPEYGLDGGAVAMRGLDELPGLLP